MTTAQQSFEEHFLRYVGGRVYGAVFRLTAARFADHVPAAGAGLGAGDEIGEEIVVFGESLDTGGGGVDVITMDPWMTDFQLVVVKRAPGDRSRWQPGRRWWRRAQSVRSAGAQP